jgi:RNA polymerase sigma-70 factor (sigma-E family)
VNTVADVAATAVETTDVLEGPVAIPVADSAAADVALTDDVMITDKVMIMEDVTIGDDVAIVSDILISDDGDIRDECDPQSVGHVDGVNLVVSGEPSNADARLTEVTETLAASALVPEIAFAPEPRSVAAVWDAGQAVTEIYAGHYGQLVRLALLLVRDVQTAEEVVQDAFVSMNDAWRRLHDAEKALSYLRQTVVNRSRSVLRHRKVVDMHAPKPAPDEPSAEHAAMAALESDAVGAALKTLPERQREAIVLRYYLDLSEADIAKTMGISRGAVKSHTARAMAALKAILQQETS